MNSENRLHWMDAVRCLACLSVTSIHATYTGGTGGQHAIAIYDYYAVASASIVFFMLTGALSLWKPQPLGSFIAKRLRRVALPMVLWSVITLMAEAYLGNISWHELPRQLAMIPIRPQVSYFWFIYFVMGIYLITPVFAAWLATASRRHVLLLLSIWGFTLTLPLLSILWPALSQLTNRTHGMLFYFQGYAGLLLLGYYIRRWGSEIAWRWWYIIPIAFLLGMPMLLHATHWHTTMLLNRLSPNVVALGAIIVLFFSNLHYPTCLHRPLAIASQVTFGVYLSHRLVIILLVEPIFKSWHPNYWFGIPLATLLTAATCAAITLLLSRTRIASWMGCLIQLK